MKNVYSPDSYVRTRDGKPFAVRVEAFTKRLRGKQIGDPINGLFQDTELRVSHDTPLLRGDRPHISAYLSRDYVVFSKRARRIEDYVVAYAYYYKMGAVVGNTIWADVYLFKWNAQDGVYDALSPDDEGFSALVDSILTLDDLENLYSHD